MNFGKVGLIGCMIDLGIRLSSMVYGPLKDWRPSKEQGARSKEQGARSKEQGARSKRYEKKIDVMNHVYFFLLAPCPLLLAIK